MTKKLKNIYLLLTVLFVSVFLPISASMANDPAISPYIARPTNNSPATNNWSSTPSFTPTNGGQEQPISPYIARPADNPTTTPSTNYWQNYNSPAQQWANDWRNHINYEAKTQANVEPSSSGLFSDLILQKMNQFMLKTNEALHSVMMIGDGLMCYSIYVHYHPVDLKGPITGWTYKRLFTYPDPTFFIVGLVIYVVGVCMAMSVGMYFMDISYKFGFAIIFMPISIALWPFPPTKSKFADNLSIIIRNAMLFMLLGIGVSYAVRLINNGLLADGSANDFWSAIENDEVEQLTNSFSFFNTHILVVFFCLIYGFKILEGSVNDYLNAFFSDAAFGSESPMHHMGTQAVGMISENTVKPALSFAKDVATHQTGRAIAGTAKGAGMMFSSEGRAKIGNGIKTGYNKAKSGITTAAKGITFAAKNPKAAANNVFQYGRTQYNKGMQKAGAAANKGVHMLGNAAKSIHDNVTAFVPLPARESWRQSQVNAFNNMIDRATNKVGGGFEKAIAHGGGAMKNAYKQHKNKQSAQQLLDDLNAGGEKGKAAREQLNKLGIKQNEIQGAIGSDNEKVRKDAVNKIAGKIQQQQQMQDIQKANKGSLDKGGSGASGKGADGATDGTDNKSGQDRAQALLNYKQNEEQKIDEKLKPKTDEIKDRTKAIDDEFNEKLQKADQEQKDEYAAIDNDSTLTDEEKVQKKAQADRKNKLAHQQIEKDRAKAMKPVEKLKRQVKQQKLKHLHKYMKENTGEDEYKRWAKERAADGGDDIAQKVVIKEEKASLKGMKEKTKGAETNVKDAENERKTAKANLEQAEKNLKNAPDNMKQMAEAELQQAQQEYDRAVAQLNQARADLSQAEAEYMQAINDSQISATGKFARKAQLYNQQSNRTISLSPDKAISALFRLVTHPIDQMERIADNWETLKKDDSKMYVKGGRILLRTAKDVGRIPLKTVDAVGTGLTSILQKFGEGLADNSSHNSNRGSIKQQLDAKNREMKRQKALQAEENEFFREMRGE